MGSQIELGHAMLTFIEPHPDGLIEYNRWYEHDHAYTAVTNAPGCFAYRRFVAIKPLKALRYPPDSAMVQPIEKGSFISLFWFEKEKVAGAFDYSFAVTPALVEAGRMNGDRDHVSTAVYDYLGGTGRGPDAVPAEIALDHPYAGLAVLWIRPLEGVTVEELGAWCRDTLDGDIAAGLGRIGQVVDFAQTNFPNGMPPLTGRVEELVRCYFLDADPREVWSDELAGIGKAVEAGGKGRVELAVPFIPTVPGTKRYLDELW
jgi:hypothetical protein